MNTQQKSVAVGRRIEYPYVAVLNPGTDEEEAFKAFPTYNEAICFVSARITRGAHFDVMKRMPDGSLTSEF